MTMALVTAGPLTVSHNDSKSDCNHENENDDGGNPPSSFSFSAFSVTELVLVLVLGLWTAHWATAGSAGMSR